MDDTTLSEKVLKGQQSRAQEAVDHVSNWSAEKFFQLNLEKTRRERSTLLVRPRDCPADDLCHYDVTSEPVLEVSMAAKK